MLEFVGDAICLSGLTGTKLKCDVIGGYYNFWWKITSGGESRGYQNPTAIIELNAATGEVYVKDIDRTVLGSAGHALELKMNPPNTNNLQIVLIEDDLDCYSYLKRVIKRRWPSIFVEEAEGPIDSNNSGIYLFNTNLDEALEKIENLNLGNAIYFFDPLRSVKYSDMEKVTGKRMDTFFKTGTEFFIFLFTSDWFLGRDEFSPLPCTPNENEWTEEERKTVLEADSLFGSIEWHNRILNNNPIDRREEILIKLYKDRLHRWFRYILPLPFKPKQDQIFHLILCSNYEIGVRATREFYSSKTGNPRYTPNNSIAFERFEELHPDVFEGLDRRKRPLQWRILWSIIKQHEGGICDCMCKDIKGIEQNIGKRQNLLEWLERKGYLSHITIQNAWDLSIKQYTLNWSVTKERLGVDSPSPLRPLSLEEITNESG